MLTHTHTLKYNILCKRKNRIHSQRKLFQKFYYCIIKNNLIKKIPTKPNPLKIQFFSSKVILYKKNIYIYKCF